MINAILMLATSAAISLAVTFYFHRLKVTTGVLRYEKSKQANSTEPVVPIFHVRKGDRKLCSYHAASIAKGIMLVTTVDQCFLCKKGIK